MHIRKRSLKKNRLSTKDRFRSVLRGESYDEKKPVPWYRRREHFFPLIVILVFFMLATVVKVIIQVQKQEPSPGIEQPAVTQPTPPIAEPEEDEGEMDYEQAKKVFSGS